MSFYIFKYRLIISIENLIKISVPQPPHNKFDEFGNRISGFEGDDDPYIFDVKPIFPNNNSIKGGGGSGTNTNNNNNYRPSPPQPNRKELNGI